MSVHDGVLVIRQEQPDIIDQKAKYSANVARLHDPGLFQDLLSQARYTGVQVAVCA